jgi:hypothetical protein
MTKSEVDSFVAVKKFTTVFEGWSPAHEVFPILNAEKVLIGGFLVIEGPVWKCFISARGYPESLMLEDPDNAPWVTPIRNSDGAIDQLLVSTIKMNDESKRIYTTENESEQ